MERVYDCIVIGKGLMGAAAAKYLSQSDANMAIIGSDEPTDLAQSTVFSSHYDQARIQRQIGLDGIWTLLNKQSAAAYSKLEIESGIHFHDGVGCLYVQPAGEDGYLKNAPIQSKQFDIECSFYENGEVLHQSFSDYKFPNASCGLFETAPSGSINPRLLIKAQLELVKKNGGHVFSETVSNIKYVTNQIEVKTLTGKTFLANKILFTSGSFTNFLPLPKEQKLALSLKSETIVLASVNKIEADHLSKLPSLLYEIDNADLDGIYLIRPVKYPDGNYYIKMGCNFPDDIYFDNLVEIKHWFLQGDSERHLQTLKNALVTILPNVKFEDFVTKRCIITRTPHGKPYIGEIGKNIFIATGGNGYSAMCSDALGAIASHLLVKNRFPINYPRAAFMPLFNK